MLASSYCQIWCLRVFGHAATSLLLAHHQIPHIALANRQLRAIITDHIDLLSETIRTGSPLNYPEILRQSKDKAEQEKTLHEFYGAFKAEILITATDLDEIPSGYGPFGLCKTNPIPTKDIAGSNEYLSKLQLISRDSLSWERVGATTSEVTDGMVDMYQIKSDDVDLVLVYICPYHKKNSERPPDGFLLC